MGFREKMNRHIHSYPLTHLLIYKYLFNRVIFIGMWAGYVFNANIHAGFRHAQVYVIVLITQGVQKTNTFSTSPQYVVEKSSTDKLSVLI